LSCRFSELASWARPPGYSRDACAVRIAEANLVGTVAQFFLRASLVLSQPAFLAGDLRTSAVMLRSILRSPEDNPGGGGSEQQAEPGPTGSRQPAQAPPPASPTEQPDPPPAAETVNNGRKTERELALEQDLEAERLSRRKEQTRISELENENHQLKQVGREPKKPKGPKGSAFRVLGWED
jgi:hypothetical protein